MNRTRMIATSLIALVALACRPEPAPPAGIDARTPVPLPPEAFEAVHAEMRTMLASVHQLHAALAAHDTSAARLAATASGLAAAADPALEPLLPAEFLRLGVATHAGFDSITQALDLGMPRDSTLARLARTTATCVTCHATYRLTLTADLGAP